MADLLRLGEVRSGGQFLLRRTTVRIPCSRLVCWFLAASPLPGPNLASRVCCHRICGRFSCQRHLVDDRGSAAESSGGRAHSYPCDDNGDGRPIARRAIADSPRDGARASLGKDSLFASGDGGRRFPSATATMPRGIGADRAAQPVVSRGPRSAADGWLYWLLGNSGGRPAPFAQLDTRP